MSPLWIRTAVFASPTKHSWRDLDDITDVVLKVAVLSGNSV